MRKSCVPEQGVDRYGSHHYPRPQQPARLGFVVALRLQQSTLSLGILALVLWATSWSWLVGVGVTVVRFGEVGALLVGVAAVAVGLAAPRRSENVGLWLGVVTLVLVVG